VRTETIEAIAPIAGEWDALVHRTGAPPFMRPGWVAAWCAAFGTGPLSVVCAWRDGRLAGVLPLQRRSGALTSTTNGQTPAFGPVAEDAEVARALARATFAAAPRHVHLAHLDASDPALAELERVAADAGYRLLRTTIQRSPVVALAARAAPGTGLSAKDAANLRRRRRRLARTGRVAVEVSDGAERLDELLREGLRLEGSGWKERRGTAIASRGDTRRFYDDVARWARAEGLLRLAFLRLDGRGLAFELALQDARAWWFLKGGYDPGAARHAPGKLLAHEMIARAAAAGLERFEFLGAAEAWKVEFTRECRERVRVQAFAPTTFGAADRLAQTGYRRYAWPLARRALGRRRGSSRAPLHPAALARPRRAP
jgi:CelD/BcsL family acetyltransferase involved in cellulose biosynthesis